MTSTEKLDGLAATRLIKRADMVSCDVAFIDCKLEGSTPKLNYSIIGAGVTQSDDQVINLEEPHGFAIGAAAMPRGVTNNLHIHYTAEVFMVFAGEWLFRWGPDGGDGEIIGRAGDVLSMPTWIFRGFTNIGDDNGWIFTALGRDHSGGVIWDPNILERAAYHGLYLSKDNMLLDVEEGSPPCPGELIKPLTPQFIASLRHYTPDEMRARVTTAAERKWSENALLDSVLPGHRSALAPVIGYGMTQDRDAASKVTNSHGFSVEWLRIDAGNGVGAHRISPKQVLILAEGQVEVSLFDGQSWSSALVESYDVFSIPGDCWRRLRATGDRPAIMTLTTAGDARAMLEWDPEIVAAAREHGRGLDPNGYVADATYLPASEAA